MLTKTDHNTAGIRLEFSRKTIPSAKEIDLGVSIDTNSHITKICRKAFRLFINDKEYCADFLRLEQGAHTDFHQDKTNRKDMNLNHLQLNFIQ